MQDDETDDDGGEDDEDEDVEQKDPDNQKEKVEEGGQTNPVTPDPEDGLKEETDEEEATPSEKNNSLGAECGFDVALDGRNASAGLGPQSPDLY